jgi:folate-binding protein YgfZ
VFATTPLPELRLITVAGPERLRFLQGQLTQDLALVTPGTTCLAGWAEPKGRLLWAGHLVLIPGDAGDRFGMVVPAALADALAQQLRRFVLRAKVTVDVDGTAIAGIDAGTPPAPPGNDYQLAGDHTRALRISPPTAGLPDASASASAAWELADIRAGIPVVEPATSGQFVPQMLNLDLLAGVSFTKGCYPGQEIVARTRYLGRVKRRMFRFGAAVAPPPPGTTVYGPRGAVGQVVRAAATPGGGTELLAVVVLDDLASPLFLEAGERVALERLTLPYAIPEAIPGAVPAADAPGSSSPG